MMLKGFFAEFAESDCQKHFKENSPIIVDIKKYLSTLKSFGIHNSKLMCYRKMKT